MAKSSSLFLFLLLALCTTNVYSELGGRGTIVGGKKEIKNVKSNREVQDLGRFSVEQFNSNNHGGPPLKFSQVVEAQSQVVSGIKYYLKVEAIQNGVPKTFDAVVVVKQWLRSNPKQLLSFTPKTSN